MSLALRLLAAGACYTNEKTFQKCALQPTECLSPLVYRSSQWLSGNDSTHAATCASQGSIVNIPALGRCDSESERFICTSHKSACRVDIAFAEYDAECTVLDDFRPVDTPFVRSYYGECTPNEDAAAAGVEPYCAWQFNECNSAEGLYTFESADRVLSNQMPSCQCDGVKTGACVDSTNSENFFCAITAEVCSAETGFTYLKSYQVESDLKTTCKLCDTVPPPPETRYASAGACIVDSTGEFKRCALIPDHCDGSGETFYSPKALETAPNKEAAAICKTQEGLHQVRLGRCIATVDQNICVSDGTACTIAQSFQSNEDTCLLVEDVGSTSAFDTTHYGHCSTNTNGAFEGYQKGGENYCAWGFTECKSDDTSAPKLTFGKALPGMSATVPKCQCDDVRTGACISDSNPGDSYCAVAASACDSGYSYSNVRALEDPLTTNTVCFLCQTLPSNLNAPSPEAALPVMPSRPSSPVSAPQAPVSAPPQPRAPTSPTLPTLEAEIDKEIKDDGLAVGAIIGIVFGVLLSTCIFSVAFCFARQKASSNNSTIDQKQVENNTDSVRDTEEGVLTPSNPSFEKGQVEEDFVPQDDRSVN